MLGFRRVHVAATAAGFMLCLGGYGPAQAVPEADLLETIGAAPDVDSYLVTCGHATTRALHVFVCDNGPSDDTVFLAQIIGRTPAGILGKTVIADSTPGACSPVVHLLRGAASGSMSAIVTVTQRNNAGAEQYRLFLQCEDKNLVPVGNITVTKKQDNE